MLNVNYRETSIKKYLIDNTIYSQTVHLTQRMNERGISEIDLKIALKYGKRFKDPSGETKAYSIIHIDECDYDGQRTKNGTKATYIIVCHDKNKYAPGRVITSAWYDDENGGKIQFNIFGKKMM